MAVEKDGDDNDNNNNNNNNEKEYDEDDEFSEWFQSIRSPTGLEIGIQVTWPNVRPFSLSTVLDASEMAPIFHGTQWAGTRIWNASVVALQYLLLLSQHHQSSKNKDGRNTKRCITDLSSNPSSNEQQQPQQPLFQIGSESTVLELGCGLGIPGILLHEITSCSVVLTDKESLVNQLQCNLNEIFSSVNATKNKKKGSIIEARSLDWSEEGVKILLQDIKGDEEQCTSSNIVCPSCENDDDGCRPSSSSSSSTCCRSFDVVLNCDCVYEPLYGRAAWQSLIACQKALLEANPKTILITSLERRKADGVEQYLEALAQICETVELVQLSFPHDPKIEIYQAYGLVL